MFEKKTFCDENLHLAEMQKKYLNSFDKQTVDAACLYYRPRILYAYAWYVSFGSRK